MVELELHSEEALKYHAKKLLDEIITEVNFKMVSFDAGDLVRAAIDLSQGLQRKETQRGNVYTMKT
jgi:hypothetical protein